MPRPAISVLLPTVRPWPEAEDALASLLRQDFAETCEILLLDGDGAGAGGTEHPAVRVLREPGGDVFALRALGLAQAQGEIVAVSEDHCLAPPGWLAAIRRAHRESARSALVGPVANHPESARAAVDRANFLLTFGPFAPRSLSLPRDRLPPPTNLSVKRRALPEARPAAGWLEYEALAAWHAAGELGLAPEALLEHRQVWGPRLAPPVHFASGRAFGGALHAASRAVHRQFWRGLPNLPRRIWRQTRGSLLAGEGGAAPGLADRMWLGTLILCNTLGQAIGVWRGPGRSRSRLV